MSKPKYTPELKMCIAKKYLSGEGSYGFLAEKYGIGRYSINEIYARHHYRFASEEYATFFQKYDWYEGYLSSEEAVKSFNTIEHENIVFLLNVEKEYMS